MPSKYTSPYASSFKSAINRGTSYTFAVNSIAKRWNKTPEFIWQSLYKAGLCYRQKFNGQWIYWPCNVKKGTAKTWKYSQFYMWQWFTEWCFTNGWATPQQFKNHTGSQQDFMTFCRKFFGKQYNWNKPKRKTTKAKHYKFPSAKVRTTRRYRKAA